MCIVILGLDILPNGVAEEKANSNLCSLLQSNYKLLQFEIVKSTTTLEREDCHPVVHQKGEEQFLSALVFHRAARSPTAPATMPPNPAIVALAAPFCRPASLLDVAAPAAPVGLAVSVTGALTTMRDVLVWTVPSGRVV